MSQASVMNEAQECRPLVDIGTLAARLKAELDDAMQARKMVEDRWLQDLRQYRGQYEPAMQERLRALLGTEAVNVKATTEEGLGFTGSGEGIACHAVCLLEECT